MNQKGFTLIETLLVLVVLTIVTLIASHIVVKISEENEVEHFFQQLELDVIRVQSYSIENNNSIYIGFFPSNNTYRAVSGFNNILFERKMPDSIELSPYSNLKTIEFSGGQIRNFGTVSFKYNNKDISFILYIEKGRTRVVTS